MEGHDTSSGPETVCGAGESPFIPKAVTEMQRVSDVSDVRVRAPNTWVRARLWRGNHSKRPSDLTDTSSPTSVSHPPKSPRFRRYMSFPPTSAELGTARGLRSRPQPRARRCRPKSHTMRHDPSHGPAGRTPHLWGTRVVETSPCARAGTPPSRPATRALLEPGFSSETS